MSYAVFNALAVAARVADDDARERRPTARRDGGDNGGHGFRTGLLLFVIGIVAIVFSLVVEARGANLSDWAPAYDANGLPVIVALIAS